MINIHRMVGRLRQLVQDAHATSGHGGSRKDSCAEIFLADSLRTGESEQDASRFDFLESFHIQFAIALQGIAQGIPVFGKGGWVEDNQVILVAHTVQIFKGILGKGSVTAITREIQLYILIGKVNRFGGTVYRMYQFGIATHGINGETARVAEHIQYRAPVCIAFQQRTVFALVYKEACLLSFQPVDVEFQSLLHGYVVRAASFQEAILRIEVGFEGQGRF